MKEAITKTPNSQKIQYLLWQNLAFHIVIDIVWFVIRLGIRIGHRLLLPSVDCVSEKIFRKLYLNIVVLCLYVWRSRVWRALNQTNVNVLTFFFSINLLCFFFCTLFLSYIGINLREYTENFSIEFYQRQSPLKDIPEDKLFEYVGSSQRFLFLLFFDCGTLTRQSLCCWCCCTFHIQQNIIS